MVLVLAALFAIVLNPPNNEVASVTLPREVVTAGEVNPQNWAVVIRKASPRVIGAEAVYHSPPFQIRGPDSGVSGAEDAVELGKVRQKKL